MLSKSTYSCSHPIFFFLLLRLPPTSTLFPYTTLFRSVFVRSVHRLLGGVRGRARGRRDDRRSEEHTSELQSHSDLVCRLLLEKKKDRYGERLPLFGEVIKRIRYVDKEIN